MPVSKTKLTETFNRIDTFGDENAAVINANQPAKAAFKAVKDGLGKLDAAGVLRTSAETTKFNKTTERGTLRNHLTDELQEMAKFARLLAKKNVYFENKFRLPRGGRNDANLLETVRAWIADAESVKPDFAAYGLDADFFTALETDADRFAEVIGEQDSSNSEKIGATASIEDTHEEMLDAKRTLDVVVPRLFRDNPAKLAQWLSASHVERSSQREKTNDQAEKSIK